MKKGVSLVLFLGCMVGCICWYREVGAAVLAAGTRCVQVLVPSLYLYSVLAAWYVESGVSALLAKPLNGFTTRFLHMDAELCLLFLFSQCGGYPVGIQMLEGLRRAGRITSEQEGRLACVCLGSGPAFLLGTVCQPLHLHGWAVGMLWLSLCLPNLLLAFWMAGSGTFQLRAVERCPAAHGGLTTAVEHAAAAMLKLCGMVLVFAGGIAMLEAAGIFAHSPSPLWKTGVSAMLEVSAVTEFLTAGGSLPWIAACLSFGGICVHCQISAIAEGRLPWGRFLCTRLAAAVGSWWLCRWGLLLLDRCAIPVWNLQTPVSVPAEHPAQSAAVVCLLVMSVMLLQKTEQYGRMQPRAVRYK